MNNYIINDIDEFTDQARMIVYANFGKDDSSDEDVIDNREMTTEEKAEMDAVLTHNECRSIVYSFAKKQVNKKTKVERFIINEKIFSDIIESINSRLVSNILSGLIKKGLIESAYDDKLNDFVFWVKEDENTKNHKKSDPDSY